MDPIRHAKAQKMRTGGLDPYPSAFARSHTLHETKELKDGKPVSTAGRIMLLREMGGMTFAHLQDHTGRLQIAFKEDELKKAEYIRMLELLDLGDIIGITGKRFTTKKGELTVLVKEWTMLCKALRQPPEKWHGIAEQETAWRQRYLDTLSNRETFERFEFRSFFLQKLREFYWSNEFLEVETPILTGAASGALAEPFITHHAAYDLDLYLRIAPETFLKECLIGGFDRVFEVARCFRNEGLDPSHLQDFTMVEHYAAYWDYHKNMEFTEQMFGLLIPELIGKSKIKIPDRESHLVTVDFAPPWPRISIQSAILDGCGINIAECSSQQDLLKAIGDLEITLDVPVEKLSRGNLIDQLYKKVARPKILQPTFITEHPIDLSPLARRSDLDPTVTDRFQLVVGGWEIVNAYSELIDPVDQAARFEDQARAAAKGDTAAHRKDDEFVKALEYGCPPCSGWGMGIDRIVALLTQQRNLRDVVLFPLMKPRKDAPADLHVHVAQPLLLQHAEYGHLLPAAHALLEEHATNTKAHLIATGAAMAALATKFGGDPDTWRVAGMLHDLDWDSLDKDFEKHCGEELDAMLRGIKAPPELLADIRAHYAKRYGADYPLNSMLRKCLYCCDELTGFIIATTLVRPSKKIADTEVSSIKKKLKDKTFARQVDREQIAQCESLLNIPLDDFISLTLSAMKGVADPIGL
ncbi:lysine--tRNA ligase [Candidatus Peregrinibacteria bacterium]|nr:lysine--tRNA ligase [Candidatus Peregrinibacteria bacterium]